MQSKLGLRRNILQGYPVGWLVGQHRPGGWLAPSLVRTAGRGDWPLRICLASTTPLGASWGCVQRYARAGLLVVVCVASATFISQAGEQAARLDAAGSQPSWWDPNGIPDPGAGSQLDVSDPPLSLSFSWPPRVSCTPSLLLGLLLLTGLFRSGLRNPRHRGVSAAGTDTCIASRCPSADLIPGAPLTPCAHPRRVVHILTQSGAPCYHDLVLTFHQLLKHGATAGGTERHSYRLLR
jgi:hypothetical protein